MNIGVACIMIAASYAGGALAHAAGPIVDASCEVGLTPVTLAVSGATAAEATGVLQAIAASTSERTALTSAKAEVDAALVSVSQARAALDIDPGQPDASAALANAVSALGQAQSGVLAARQQLLAAATTGLSTQVKSNLASCAARTGRRVPPEFLVSTVNAASFDALEGAVLSEQRGISSDLSAAEVQLLAQVRAESAVIAAVQGVQSNLSAITAAFNAAN